ncbi:MAG: TPM domain-containing protein [Bacteroidales bacterium]|nr:TPM domain-containing protein [Bacteroidales bacterium]
MKKLIVILLLLAVTPAAFSQSEWTPKKSNRLVNDYSHILTNEQLSTLEQRLVAFNDSTSNQIVIVITPTLHGDASWAVATRIGQQWGVGQKEFNNGVVILIKSKTKEEPDGDVFIATGKGVEAVLPDAFCKRIIDDKMIGPLGDGDYYKALTAALDIIEPVLQGEYSYAQYKKDKRSSALIALLIFVGSIGVIALLLWLYYRKHPEKFKNDNHGDHGTGGHTFGSYPWFMGGSSHGGGWSSGGGFGGFGGGSFGGGGAHGKF